MLKIAAIDVGSNAMRMMVGEVDESWRVSTVENIRLPVRLGQDIFSKGYLESETIQQTESAFLRFKHIADNYGVQRMRAMAASAARAASNGDLLIERVLGASGIELEFISGEEEARLIHLAVTHTLNLKNKRTLAGRAFPQVANLSGRLRKKNSAAAHLPVEHLARITKNTLTASSATLG